VHQFRLWPPRIRKLLDDAEWDVRLDAIILLRVMQDKSSTSQLLASLDARDWRVSYATVDTLYFQNDPRATEALKTIARSYWHPAVRAEATENLSSRDRPKLPQYSFEFPEMEIQARCKQKFEADGYQFVPDFITGPEVIKQANNAVQHNQDLFRKTLLTRPEMQNAKPAERSLEFKRTLIKGTDLENGHGELTVQDESGNQKIILDGNVKAVFLWKNEPHAIVVNFHQSYRGDGRLYRLAHSVNKTWTAYPMLRLTGEGEVWIAPDHTIGYLGNGGSILISPIGEPKWLYCGQPSFP
jgi:hypothetical protein